MSATNILTAAVVALLVAFPVAGLVGSNDQPEDFGSTSTTSSTINAAGFSSTGDITAGADLTVTDDATIDGGTLTVTTSNSATSTIIVGCKQGVATSTATPIKEMYFASSTLNIDGASITAGFGGGTLQGLVLWGFGTCPGL